MSLWPYLQKVNICSDNGMMPVRPKAKTLSNGYSGSLVAYGIISYPRVNYIIQNQCMMIPPASLKLKVWYTDFTLTIPPSLHLSVRLSICPSVCGQIGVRSVFSTILATSVSHLHILSSDFKRYVICKFVCKISKFEFLAFFLICNFYFVLFWLGICY